MEKTINNLSKSSFIKFVLGYTAILATIAVLLGGWNQQIICETQKNNVENTLARNSALDNVIDRQISLYKVVKEIPAEQVQAQLKGELDASVKILEESQETIKDNQPKTAVCIIP
jgi:hypothetical protein